MLEWVDTYLLRERERQTEREIHIEWLFDGFLTASFSLAPFLDMCAFIYLFISSAVVNSFLGREPILPNGQVSIRWVRTLIARLMSWQERWVLTFDNPLIIRLPQERMLMRGRTKRWDESTLLMTVKHVKFALSSMTVISASYLLIYIYTHTHVSSVWCLMCLWASASSSQYTNTTCWENIFFRGIQKECRIVWHSELNWKCLFRFQISF